MNGFAPDGFMPDGTPIYIDTRVKTPSNLQLYLYSWLMGLTDEVASGLITKRRAQEKIDELEEALNEIR